ncbi:hypothetical protein RchiOBHm_Chr5g0007631 [Rosa chinensis]|uniref:Uncharacterized protein n=1 Tax=Rosa chinensis TaxID=74649 RepID=A0A2P6Q3W3_ROSCH|nr:hypothetical protein RchiOBHm_Chr5g0007631 [Rosa chinensis]
MVGVRIVMGALRVSGRRGSCRERMRQPWIEFGEDCGPSDFGVISCAFFSLFSKMALVLSGR